MIRMTSNAQRVAARLTARETRYVLAQEQNLRTETLLLETRVKANASGRPGPRARTGDYRRSISHRFYTGGDNELIGEVGTNKPQGRRLEFGFVGYDSLGRFYDQPPYSHFAPALETTEAELKLRMAATAKRFHRA